MTSLRVCRLNEAEVCGEVLARARREALHVPALARRLQRLTPGLPARPSASVQTPLLLTRLRSGVGEMRLFSMFSRFGAPLDVTSAWLRIEHLLAADAATAQALQSA